MLKNWLSFDFERHPYFAEKNLVSLRNLKDKTIYFECQETVFMLYSSYFGTEVEIVNPNFFCCAHKRKTFMERQLLLTTLIFE